MASPPADPVNAERWRIATAIFHAALERPADRRPSFLAEACLEDQSLRANVDALLAGDEHADAGWDLLTVDPSRELVLDETTNETSRLVPGQRFGQYRVEHLLGRGGMGEVYEAEHIEHGRRIALKVLSPGLSDAIDRARFLREGQLAAAVNHPHLVYVYGSEDISGMPAIAMELLPGGTLKGRVENEGPLAPVEAIDVIRQVVSGLEAAHDAGILHRDIKPSNCFVDVDGTVKVGDFGLAIPALEHLSLTAIGTIQATPQFASPEQLRGKPLDVRSDIYAVGATLFYLLTGRPPFDDRELMALVSRIATESPISPRELRPEIPKAVAALVLQCLAKDPAHRPASYRVLANMLEPLGSAARTPAPLGIRTAAYVFDTFFAIFLPVNILFGTFVDLARPSSMFDAKSVLLTFCAMSYFAIAEGVWGASLGKALCGLRVVTESGAPPRFARALLRALMAFLPPWLASGAALSLAGLVYSMQGRSAIMATAVQIGVHVLLMATARRANGFAGIHEWASRTRTVLRAAVGTYATVQSAPSPVDIPVGSQRVGPYWIVETPSSLPGAVLGYDDRLRRTIWLRFPGAEADAVPLVRRNLRRTARPRWLAGQRASGLAWDAYEQVPGQPFEISVRGPQSWKTVRGWLCDLAEEIQAGLCDGSLPTLDVDRVWIGRDARARLLDWPAPGDGPDRASSPASQQVVDLPLAERFLYRVAVSALEGRVLAEADSHARALRVPLPLQATECLARLGELRFSVPDDMLTALKAAARAPASISRAKRVMHLSLCAFPTVFILVIGFLSVYNMEIGVTSAHPHVRSVNADGAADRAGIEADDIIVAIDGEPITFVSDLQDATNHPNRLITLSIVRKGQPLIVRATPRSGSDRAMIGIEAAEETPELTVRVAWRNFWLHTMVGLTVAAAVGLFCAVVSRGGIALRLIGAAVVTRNGAPASGARARLRAALSWAPVLAASAALFAGHSPLLTLTPPASQFYAVKVLQVLPVFFPSEPTIVITRVAIVTVALTVFAIGVIAAVIEPERGLQDRLAGTWLVPG